ncbi:hypothetical protein EBZ35_08295, partial [bacterium]|nr:hypothetical protein [bacterium]
MPPLQLKRGNMTTQHDHATEHRHVLIIGNGFDLQHGFKTRYGDFAKWLNDNRDQHHDNVWSQYVVNVYRQNTTTHDQKTWIDLEKAIEAKVTSLSISRVGSYRKFPIIVPFKELGHLLNYHDYDSTVSKKYHELKTFFEERRKDGERYSKIDHRDKYIKSCFMPISSRDYPYGRVSFVSKVDYELNRGSLELMTPDIKHLIGPDLDYARIGLDDKHDVITFCRTIQTIPDLVERLKNNETNLPNDHQPAEAMRSFLLDCYRTVTWRGFKEWQENNWYNQGNIPPILLQTEKDFIDFLYWQLQRLIAQFDSYLQSVFVGVDAQTAIKESPFRLPCDPTWSWSTTNVVSFNYTHTYQAIGKLRCPTVTAIDDQVIHIHGQMGQHNMVLGTRTMEHTGSAEWHRFHKHTQRMVKDTISRYQDLLADIKKAHKVTIGVVGHSLDTSDHAILKHLLMANPNTRVRVYYHSADHLVAMNHNITTIMGEDAVTEKVRFICQYDHHD